MSDDLLDMLKHVFNGSEVEIYGVDERGMYLIQGRNSATREDWELIDLKSGEPVPLGETLRLDNGDQYCFVGYAPPHKPQSTGRVYVREYADWPVVGDGPEMSYFPSVFNCKLRYKKRES